MAVYILWEQVFNDLPLMIDLKIDTEHIANLNLLWLFFMKSNVFSSQHFFVGPVIWYQVFEYAIGHWFQKATEHVFGCVLCSPGQCVKTAVEILLFNAARTSEYNAEYMTLIGVHSNISVELFTNCNMLVFSILHRLFLVVPWLIFNG